MPIKAELKEKDFFLLLNMHCFTNLFYIHFWLVNQIMHLGRVEISLTPKQEKSGKRYFMFAHYSTNPENGVRIHFMGFLKWDSPTLKFVSPETS